MPARSFQVVVKPSEQDLIGWQSKKFVNCFSIIEQPIQFGVLLDSNSSEKPFPDDLPDKTHDKVFCSLCNIARSNVDDATANCLGGRDDNIVVLGHLERVERFLTRDVQDASVDGVRHRVIDEFTENEAICHEHQVSGSSNSGCELPAPLHSSNSCIVFVGIGSRPPISGSPSKTYSRGEADEAISAGANSLH